MLMICSKAKSSVALYAFVARLQTDSPIALQVTIAGPQAKGPFAL